MKMRDNFCVQKNWSRLNLKKLMNIMYDDESDL